MCGVVGIVSFDAKIDKSYIQIVNSMLESISHRGPDSSGIFLENRVVLGACRLAINGILDGDQPIVDPKSKVAIVCNGELYNYKNWRKRLVEKGHEFLTNSDVEVILHLYIEFGIEFINKIDAEFVCAIYDPKVETTFIIRDRFGVKPVYYYFDEQNLVFASEIKAIFQVPGTYQGIDTTNMLYSFLRFDILDRSAFKGINILKPGNYIELNKEHMTVQKYWDFADFLEDLEPCDDRFDQACQKTDYLLTQSVSKRLDSDSEIGCFLSGGLDSSLLVALMNKCGPLKSIKTFSINFTDTRYSEKMYFNLVSDLFETSHHSIEVSARDQSKHFPKALYHCEHFVQQIDGTAKLMLAELASKSVKSVLVGEGADEIFLGYPSFLLSQSLNYGVEDIRSIVSRQTSRYGIDYIENQNRKVEKMIEKYGYYPMQVDALDSIIDIANELLSPEFKSQLSSKDFLDYALKDAKVKKNISSVKNEQIVSVKETMPSYLFEYLGGKVEMASSIESRLPYLDFELVKYACSLPIDYHIHGGIEKFLLRSVSATSLPKELADRPKHGFSSSITDGFLGLEKIDYFDHFTSPEYCDSIGYFDGKAVQKLKSKIVSTYSMNNQIRTMRERALVFVLSVHLLDVMFSPNKSHQIC